MLTTNVLFEIDLNDIKAVYFNAVANGYVFTRQRKLVFYAKSTDPDQ